MHALTPAVMALLEEESGSAPASAKIGLSPALLRLAHRERYLACELDGHRYDIGAKYGLFTAQLALALEGREREEVLSGLVELLASQRR
jgi:UTP--glucose-1-phosphate uridylyltransferase